MKKIQELLHLALCDYPFARQAFTRETSLAAGLQAIVQGIGLLVLAARQRARVRLNLLWAQLQREPGKCVDLYTKIQHT